MSLVHDGLEIAKDAPATKIREGFTRPEAAMSRSRAAAEFKRMMLWIALAGVLMVIAALFYISLYEPLRMPVVIATVLGVFLSVLLGAGLFAAAFFSDKSGYDQSVTDATRHQDKIQD